MFSPLERRVFRLKKPAIRFLCPLCGTERALNYRSRLTRSNYVQIVVMSVVTVVVSYPWFAWRAFFFFFLYWISLEGTIRYLFKRQLPCPHCGFDAIWYKRDVKIARQKVQEFWSRPALVKK